MSLSVNVDFYQQCDDVSEHISTQHMFIRSAFIDYKFDKKY